MVSSFPVSFVNHLLPFTFPVIGPLFLSDGIEPGTCGEQHNDRLHAIRTVITPRGRRPCRRVLPLQDRTVHGGEGGDREKAVQRLRIRKGRRRGHGQNHRVNGAVVRWIHSMVPCYAKVFWEQLSRGGRDSGRHPARAQEGVQLNEAGINVNLS